MEEAATLIAAKAASHLAANEVAHVTLKNASSLQVADSARVQAAVERGLRKRVRAPMTVEVALTISESARGFLLIAQIRDSIEMMNFRVEAAKPTATASIAKTLIWQQMDPILDAVGIDDQILVLDTKGLARYEHRERVEFAAISQPMPRDPRGRMEMAGSAVTLGLPGSTCKSLLKPLLIHCENGGEFVAGRNTQISESESAKFEGWGDSITVCNGTRVLASGAGDRESRDFVALYVASTKPPVRVSEPLEFSGPVMALHPALAVARDLSTGRYEAYSLTVDCGR